jgi:hypothetical protein
VSSACSNNDFSELLSMINERLESIERQLSVIKQKEFYTVDETATRLGYRPYTVREWCRQNKLPGAKKVHGKGRQGEWRIPYEAIVEIENGGVRRSEVTCPVQ